jgi:serpin B
MRRALLTSKGILTFNLLLAVVALASCSTPNVEASDDEAREVMKQSNGAERAAMGTSQFGHDLGERIKDGEGNAVWSPYSIASAMEMVHLGARGETADEMAATLHSGAEPHAQMHALQEMLGNEPSAKLRIVNDVWLQDDFEMSRDYMDGLERFYSAEPRMANFKTAAEAARQAINGRVSEVTEQKIEELLPEGSLDPAVRLVLVNAIYMNARWLDPFPADQTKPRPFHLADGSSVDVDTMHKKHLRKYVDAGDFQAVTLPYAGNLAAMVVLPDEDEFASVAGSMNAATMQKLRDKMESRDVDLYLPKFRVRTSERLSRPLSDMGMSRVFDRERADLSGMSDAQLHVDEVYHEAFIDVHEKGTEAAAATGAVVRLTSGALPQEEVEMRVDRPFLFYVMHQETGAILFAARVVDPTAK